MNFALNNSALTDCASLGNTRSEWLERCLYWSSTSPEKKSSSRRVRQPKREPLILTGHGMRLRVDNRALLVRGGLTHYPQKAEEWRFFPGDRSLPSRIIVIDGS